MTLRWQHMHNEIMRGHELVHFEQMEGRLIACPYTGKKCGCGSFPWLIDGKLPETCQMGLTLPMVEMYAGKVSPERAAEAKRWVAAGRPRLDRWVGENDDVYSDRE